MPTKKQHAWKRGNHLEDRLDRGEYREWFWDGLDETQINFLKAPVQVPAPPPADNHLVNWQSSTPRGWDENSACADADPLLFFTESHYPKREYLKPDAGWRQYCPQCPVRETCLQAARDSESVGIWGGKLFIMERNNTKPVEYDETNITGTGAAGRPRKVKTPTRMSATEREKAWEEMQKEINDRISATGTH